MALGYANTEFEESVYIHQLELVCSLFLTFSLITQQHKPRFE